MAEEKIKVRLNVKGIEVEIECLPSQLNEAIKNVLESFGEVGSETTTDFRPLTCKEAVEKLWMEGWFKNSRRLGEVWNELSRRGYNYDRSAISHALNSLVREGKLTRMGRARKYQYIQKVPSKIRQV